MTTLLLMADGSLPPDEEVALSLRIASIENRLFAPGRDARQAEAGDVQPLLFHAVTPLNFPST